MLSRTVLPVLAALGLTLGACTDEPSEAALRQVAERKLMASYEMEVAQAKKLGVRPDDKPVITAFSKIGCKPADPKPGHLCTVGGAVDGKVQEQGTARFVRAADGTLTMAE